MQQTTHRHHYVPEFLLKKWAPNPDASSVGAYYWDRHKHALAHRTQGAKAFCYERDLFSVGVQNLASDVLETDFFGPVDTQGAAAMDKLVKNGVEALTEDDRSDFTRLLFSLEYRRPPLIHELRRRGPEVMEQEMDSDQGFRALLEEEGFDEAPSFYARELGLLSEDRAVAKVQDLVNDGSYGQKFINWHWSLARTRPGQGTFLLSDRPLIRKYAFDHIEAVWMLPLDPFTVFYAFRHESAKTVTNGREFLKSVNKHSVQQADKYVFCLDTSHEPLLRKHLCTRR
ncbi:MAG: DUF4238 domain-containing protein [Rhodospirillales bacterium]|nr:DUF4238 domain-containing protein [Rhodospirillales bacterium]MDE0712322.1 DUF4238 domain-containing protein [Rhodospirillales bacterium]